MPLISAKNISGNFTSMNPPNASDIPNRNPNSTEVFYLTIESEVVYLVVCLLPPTLFSRPAPSLPHFSLSLSCSLSSTCTPPLRFSIETRIQLRSYLSIGLCLVVCSRLLLSCLRSLPPYIPLLRPMPPQSKQKLTANELLVSLSSLATFVSTHYTPHRPIEVEYNPWYSKLIQYSVLLSQPCLSISPLSPLPLYPSTPLPLSPLPLCLSLSPPLLSPPPLPLSSSINLIHQYGVPPSPPTHVPSFLHKHWKLAAEVGGGGLAALLLVILIGVVWRSKKGKKRGDDESREPLVRTE